MPREVKVIPPGPRRASATRWSFTSASGECKKCIGDAQGIAGLPADARSECDREPDTPSAAMTGSFPSGWRAIDGNLHHKFGTFGGHSRILIDIARRRGRIKHGGGKDCRELIDLPARTGRGRGIGCLVAPACLRSPGGQLCFLRGSTTCRAIDFSIDNK